MIVRSPYPDIVIPMIPLTPFAMRHSERLANKRALIDASTGQSISYEQLHIDVNRAAAALAARGYRKGDVFGMLAPNSIEFAIAFHAVASIGAILAPINPTLTDDEVARQLTNTGAICLFTTSNFLLRAKEITLDTGVREIIVFGNAVGATSFDSLLQCEDELPHVAIDPVNDVVAIMCSSGTTGLPKGAQLTHYNFVAGACQLEAMGEITEADTLPGHLAMFHLFGLIINVTHGPALGATSVLMPKFVLADFLQAIQDYRITRAYLAPPTVLVLAKDPIVSQYDVTSLKTILCGAAPLGAALARECADRLNCRVKQGYGMTESGITHVSPENMNPEKIKTVGQCVPNVELRIVDFETGEDLQQDQQGEIWTRGPATTKGYLHLPAESACLVDSEGWVHTGDIGSVDADGYLTVVDRLKELIKYKAYQIAPAELEAQLLAHPSVADAAVVRSPDEVTGEVPKAFVVLRAEATAEELMAFVAARVAPYKKIRRLEFVDSIPKSPSGKILRRVLVERELAAMLSPI